MPRGGKRPGAGRPKSKPPKSPAPAGGGKREPGLKELPPQSAADMTAAVGRLWADVRKAEAADGKLATQLGFLSRCFFEGIGAVALERFDRLEELIRGLSVGGAGAGQAAGKAGRRAAAGPGQG